MIPMSRLEDLAAMAGMDDPRVRRLLQNARLFPVARESAEHILFSMCRARGIDLADEPKFDLPLNLPQDGRLLGQVLAGDNPYAPWYYPLGEVSGNLGLFGVRGNLDCMCNTCWPGVARRGGNLQCLRAIPPRRTDVSAPV